MLPDRELEGLRGWLSGEEFACQCRRRQETWVPSLGQECSLERGVATHSSILAGGILWTEGPGGLQSTGLQRVGDHQQLSMCAEKQNHNLMIMVIQEATQRLSGYFQKQSLYLSYFSLLNTENCCPEFKMGFWVTIPPLLPI